MDIVLYDRELEVMQVLWDRGPSTVADVRDDLTDEMAYNTVLTVLRRLEVKGYVGHEEEGRAHRYHALVDSRAVRESALRRITRKLFSGSPELLLTQLVADRGLSDEDLRRMREMLDERLREEEQ